VKDTDVQEKLADSWAAIKGLLDATYSGHVSGNPMAGRFSSRLEVYFHYDSKKNRSLDFRSFPTVVNDSQEAVGWMYYVAEIS
jgi:hypothetical protein